MSACQIQSGRAAGLRHKQPGTVLPLVYPSMTATPVVYSALLALMMPLSNAINKQNC